MTSEKQKSYRKSLCSKAFRDRWDDVFVKTETIYDKESAKRAFEYMTFMDSLTQEVIVFYVGEDPVLTLSKDGFTYKGKLIDDAGEAHTAFIDVLSEMKASGLVEILEGE